MRSNRFVIVVIAGLFAGVAGGCALESYDTVEEAAYDVHDAFCVHGFECGDLEERDIASCVEDLVDLTCAAQDCEAVPAASNSEIRDCVEEINGLSCDAQDFPPSCDGVLDGL